MARNPVETKPKPTPKPADALRREVADLLGAPLADAELRDRLEAMATERHFGGLTPFWGPALYRRNRVLFRPFVLSRFSTWRFQADDGWRMDMLAWKDHAGALEPWLAEADRNDDVEIFRRLYAWKRATPRAGMDEDAWRADLLDRVRAAPDRHARALALEKLNQPLSLDEPTATALYTLDPQATRDFILRHLERPWFSRGDRRKLWSGLFDLARSRGDDDLAFGLYRKLIPEGRWQAEVLRLADDLADPEELVRELERRHPEGWDFDPGETLYQLVGRRGRDIFPYVMKHLRDVWSYRSRNTHKKMTALARERGWLDLWAALVRVCGSRDEFDAEVAGLVANRDLPDREVARRLAMLCGASREWSFGPIGLASIQPLSDKTAVALYDRFPDLLRGPFRAHVSTGSWGAGYVGLVDRAIPAGDEALVDYLASRLVTRPDWGWGGAKKFIDLAERLSAYYEAFRADPLEFSRRAASVLGQVPAYTIGNNYDRLIRTNRLARLLFERSSSSFLDDPRSLRDLLESPEIHVQALALRALGLDDPRARRLAAMSLDLLAATLLRPLHRRTRFLAFRALLNAAIDEERAALVLDRARQALDLPDRRYPKGQLIGLIGRLLRDWPVLRGPRERPLIYGEAATP